MDKAERETGSVVNMEAVNPMELARVAEPEFQYGAEAFEAYERGNKEKAEDTLAKEVSKSASQQLQKADKAEKDVGVKSHVLFELSEI